MTSPELPRLAELIASRTSFAVISHLRPDGDAYGSSLGLALSLIAAGKNVVVYNQDGLDQNFAFLPGSNLVQVTPSAPPPPETAVLVVDTAELHRAGALYSSWNQIPDVNIDHHISNPFFGKINIVEPTLPATAELLYELMITLNLPITPNIASNLYVGLMTDTGCFRFRQTTGRTLFVASRLVEAGANPADLAQSCYQSFPASRLLLLREVLQATRFAENDRIAWFVLTPEMFDRSGAERGDTEGLIEHLQSVATVEVAFLLEALPDGQTRGSLRSRNNMDVQEICASFGGGGHRLAAGLRVKRPVAVVEQELLKAITARLPAQ